MTIFGGGGERRGNFGGQSSLESSQDVRPRLGAVYLGSGHKDVWGKRGTED